MLGHHRRELTPRSVVNHDGARSRHVEALASWRQRSTEEQWLALGGDEIPYSPGIEPARGRIRLGLLCPCLGLGGAEAWQLALIRAIDPESVVWRGAVVTEGKRSVVAASLGPLARRMPVGYGLGAARTLAESCDVLISWSVLDHDALFRGIERPPRVALACHFPGEMPWTEAARDLLGKVDQLVAVSELAIDSLPEALRGDARVIWNAVDAARLQPLSTRVATRTAWGVPDGVPIAGYLGRLSPEKDPDAMLRLAQHLPEPWHVVLVGDGRERSVLETKVDRLRLERVRLIPGTTEVGNVLAAINSLVVPSRFESFGLTMAEGFWSGVPVVATRSGLAKVVPGLVREVAFDPSGIELADAILTDHRDDPLGTRDRVARARSFARDRLDLARFGKDWMSVVRDLAGRSPSDQRTGGPCRLASAIR